MTDTATFPNVEQVAMDLLDALVDDPGYVTTRPDPDVAARLPMIWVRKLPGSLDNGITEISRVQVDVYAATIDQAWTIAAEAQQRLCDGRLLDTAHGMADRTLTDTAPHEVPAADAENMRLVSAVYRMDCRPNF